MAIPTFTSSPTPSDSSDEDVFLIAIEFRHRPWRAVKVVIPEGWQEVSRRRYWSRTVYTLMGRSPQ